MNVNKAIPYIVILAVVSGLVIVAGFFYLRNEDNAFQLYQATHTTMECNGQMLTIEAPRNEAQQWAVKSCGEGFRLWNEAYPT